MTSGPEIIAGIVGRDPAALAQLRDEHRQRLRELPNVPAGRPGGKVRKYSDLRDELKTAVDQLMKDLNRQELNKLRKASKSNRYPDYLQELMRLAKKHRIPLPGLDAPGPREVWDGLR